MQALLESTLYDHVSKCSATSKTFSLSGETSNQLESCFTCSVPLRIIDYMKGVVDEQHHGLLADAKEKLMLYMGHLVHK